MLFIEGGRKYKVAELGDGGRKLKGIRYYSLHISRERMSLEILNFFLILPLRSLNNRVTVWLILLSLAPFSGSTGPNRIGVIRNWVLNNKSGEMRNIV